MATSGLKYLFVILILLSISPNSFAQLELKGIVVEENTNDPLPGVNILEEYTTNKTFTDFDGKFKITVSDTATIRITYSGYFDKIIKAANYQGDPIQLKKDPNIKEVLIFDGCPNNSFFGYFGDFIKFPYGFSIYHKKNYLFRKYVGISGQINFKTDVKSNYDFMFILKKFNLIRMNGYRLSAIVSFQKRKYKALNINDLEFIADNYFTGKFNFLLGYAMKKNIAGTHKQNHGFLIGLNKNIYKTQTTISSNFKFFKNFNEYKFTILQGFPFYMEFWRNVKIGVEYQHYQDYNEYNLMIRYGFYR